MAEPLVFHLPADVLRGEDRLKPYYEKLISAFRDRGARVDLVAHDRAALPGQVAADAGFHIVDHGTHRHPRVLNTGIAYVYPFWNLDPWGIRALSSIAAKPFDPAAQDLDAVAGFAHRLRKRLIGGRRSRYPQAEDVQAIPRGCVAVFLQSEGHRQVGETCYLSLREMVEGLLARADPRPIVVKPHPRDPSPELRDWLAGLARQDRRVQVSDANIHDILAAADVVVTINSAVGIEAMLHRRPVVLCGRADFHHNAVTVADAADLDDAIGAAEGRDWPHDAFLYWYFAVECVSAGRDSLPHDVIARIASTGYDPALLGL